MSADTQREVAIEIVRRMAAGDVDALHDLWDRHAGKMLRAASKLIRRLKFDEADLDAAGAVDLALFTICLAANRGKLDSLRDSDDFWRYFARILKGVIKDANDRRMARRRGGPGLRDLGDDPRGRQSAQPARHPPGRRIQRVDAGLDSFQSADPSTEDLVMAQDSYEAFAQRLESPLLRMILRYKFEEWTNIEIAAYLEISLSSVERKLVRIREKYELDHGKR
jgi:RNA polymerase sigma factor (sigma-70 family)